MYLTPVNVNSKNLDSILDEIIMDMKRLDSKNIEMIDKRIKVCDRQKVQVACLHVINTEAYTKEDAIQVIDAALEKTNTVTEVYLMFGEDIVFIKK